MPWGMSSMNPSGMQLIPLMTLTTWQVMFPAVDCGDITRLAVQQDGITLWANRVFSVAVVDTGVRTSHEELSANCYTSADFPGEKLNVFDDNTNITDNDGHGTFIAGIVAAEGDNNRTMLGIAPGVKVIPVKIADIGTTPLGVIVAGCYLGFDLGAQVVNLSWGSYSGPVGPEQAHGQLHLETTADCSSVLPEMTTRPIHIIPADMPTASQSDQLPGARMTSVQGSATRVPMWIWLHQATSSRAVGKPVTAHMSPVARARASALRSWQPSAH